MITDSSVIRSCRFGPRLVVASFFFAVVAVATAQDISSAYLKGPYLQAPGADTMTIMWESSTNKPGIVRYGLGGVLDRMLRLEMPRALPAITNFSVTNITAEVKTNVTNVSITNTVFLYEMTLTNLRPNSVYTYSAETDGARTPPRNFKTFGARPDKVTFIAYGDTRTNPKTHAAIASNFKGHTPDFILHMGDLVADGKRYDMWGTEFFGPLARVIDEVPILPAIGNHESDGTNYLQYLHLPGKERWYSYDVGPVHVLSLDFHYEKETDDQFAFARNDLMNSRAPWKIAMLHYPVFNIGGHGTGWGHAAYLPLFHKAKLDVVIAGHSHIYERFRPIASKHGRNTWPITHITTGGGGAPLTTTYPHPALAAFVATNHFVLIEATPTSLKGWAITTNDTVIDMFELKKRNGRPPASYFAQAYPEEALKLSYDAAPSLAAELTSVPATNSFAQVRFTVHPLKATRPPVALEISLTPTSARYYELAGGSLRVRTPSLMESNRIVWANVRATGKGKITAEGKDKELSPGLIFQARMIAEAVETIAYGQKCKVTDAAIEAAKKLAGTQ
jgi:Calcineurin-like phosphoesterase/Purple acid Phosphatase, N-terminal domain